MLLPPPTARLIGQPGDAADARGNSLSTAMLSFAAKSNGMCNLLAVSVFICSRDRLRTKLYMDLSVAVSMCAL